MRATLGLWLTGLGLIALLGGIALLPGGMLLTTHESDVLHLADLVGRMTLDERPGIDFMTPIGAMALLPIAAIAGLGHGLGTALPFAQIAVALVLLPFAIRAASRFDGWLRYAFVASQAILCLALVYGGTETALSASMYYNRWAWVIAYILLVLAILPPPAGREAARLDGAILGGGIVLLALTKVTYAAAFGPIVALSLVMHRDWRGLAAAVAAGLAMLGIATAFLGWDYWPRYLDILATVSRSANRPYPGSDFIETATGPSGLLPTLLVLAAAVIARREGRRTEGLLLLTLLPAAIYVTYQNFGNDPQWLVPFALIAVQLSAPMTDQPRTLMRAVALMAAAIAFPSLLNTALSPLRQLAVHSSEAVPVTTQSGAMPILSDLWVSARRQDQVRVVTPLALSTDATRQPDSEEADAVDLNGEPLPRCEIDSGSIQWHRAVAADLMQAGFARQRILLADVLDDLWLFGDFLPVRGSWPWFYGDVSAARNADYVLVPLCPHRALEQGQFLKAVAQSGLALKEVRRTPLYILLAPSE